MSLKTRALKYNKVAKEIQKNNRMAVCASSKMNYLANEIVTLIQARLKIYDLKNRIFKR